jgi:hypothetical protein
MCGSFLKTQGRPDTSGPICRIFFQKNLLNNLIIFPKNQYFYQKASFFIGKYHSNDEILIFKIIWTGSLPGLYNCYLIIKSDSILFGQRSFNSNLLKSNNICFTHLLFNKFTHLLTKKGTNYKSYAVIVYYKPCNMGSGEWRDSAKMIAGQKRLSLPFACSHSTYCHTVSSLIPSNS